MSRLSKARVSVLMVGGFAIGLIVSLGALVFMQIVDRNGASSSIATSMDAAMEFSELPEERSVPDPASESDAPAPKDAPSTTGVDGCRAHVALGEAAVESASDSLANWRAHYGAQIAFDRGEIDGEEAKRRWAESKAPAAGDLAAYEDARAAFTAHGGCDDLDVDTLSADVRAEASACQARARETADVLVAAERSTEGWRGHLDVMARKGEFPIEEYLEIWTETVASAPGPMGAFLDAVDGLSQAPPCDTSGVDTAARDALSPRDVAMPGRTTERYIAVSSRTLGTRDLPSAATARSAHAA
jgi:hypothetical protein